MDLKWLLCIAAFASVSIKETSSSGCTLERNSSFLYNNCYMTISCYAYPNGVYNIPSCDTKYHITFIISKSSMDTLSSSFFQSTNFDGGVTEIIGLGNTWHKIDQYAFKFYKQCVRINLSVNNIYEIYNQAFYKMEKLTHINVSSNHISKLYPDTFLIRDTNVVEVLDLSNNSLDIINNELRHLTNLKTLYLNFNTLSSLAYDAFVNLENLNHLYLQKNRLGAFNVTLTYSKNLITLDLSENYLIKLTGFEIIVSLVNANFSRNALASVDTNCFNRAFSLKQVDFSHNHIRQTIERLMFVNNIALEYLDFSDNHITGLQSQSFKNNNINYLNLKNNSISGNIEEYTFSGIRNMTSLDLSQQNITGIRNYAFAGVENLHNLNLSRNSIEVIENSSFIKATINTVDFSHNKLSDIGFLKNCLTGLIGLNLSYNNIEVIPTDTFAKHTELMYLDISMNNITRIEENSLPLVKLQILNLAGNYLKGTIGKNTFSPAKYLKFLNLNDFDISKIDDMAFVDMPVLARLNLSNNQIETIAQNNFKGVNKLFSLDISHNRLRSLNSSYLTNLLALYVNNNNMTGNLSSIFSTKLSLLYLDISNNNISDVSGIGSEIFSNLTTLNLSHNSIKNFSNSSTNSLTTLMDLKLSSNELTGIELSSLKNLVSVDVSNNSIDYVNSTLLKNLDNLQLLDLSMNKIKHIPPGTFQYMHNLKSLNLSGNSLNKLRYGSLKGLANMTVLDISKNKISSLEITILHECYGLETLIIDYNQIKTFDVGYLILSLPNISVISLGANPISCKDITANIRSVNNIAAIRQVNVTSVDEIYHEDNVHGIKCGDGEIDEIVIQTSTTNKPDSNTPNNNPASLNSHIIVVLVWCALLTMLLIGTAFAIYIKLRRKRILITASSKNSLELDGREYHNDLLGD